MFIIQITDVKRPIISFLSLFISFKIRYLELCVCVCVEENDNSAVSYSAEDKKSNIIVIALFMQRTLDLHTIYSITLNSLKRQEDKNEINSKK